MGSEMCIRDRCVFLSAKAGRKEKSTEGKSEEKLDVHRVVGRKPRGSRRGAKAKASRELAWTAILRESDPETGICVTTGWCLRLLAGHLEELPGWIRG